MGGEGFEFGGAVTLAVPIAVDPQRHGRTEDGQALAEFDDGLFVQEQERTFDGGVQVGGFAAEDQVGVDGIAQLLEGELDQQVGLGGSLWRDSGEEGLQDERSGSGAAIGELADDFPTAADADLERVLAGGTEVEGSVTFGESAAVLSDAGEQAADLVDGGWLLVVEEALVEEGHGKVEPTLGVGVGLILDKQAQEGLFELGDALEPEGGVVGHLVADVGGEQGVALEQLRLGHVVEDPQHAGRDPGGARSLGWALGMERGELRQQGELVDGEVVGRRGVHDLAEDREPEFRHPVGKFLSCDDGLGFFEGLHQRARLEDGGDVLVPFDESSTLQPGDGGADLGVRHVARRVDADLEVLVAQEFARGEDDLVAAAGGLADAAQELGDVATAKFGHGPKAELRLAILLIEEEDAAGVVTVATRTPGFLEVVLEGPRRVGVDDEADVVLVDAHAERVGGADDLHAAGDEVVLDALLLGRGETGVEVFAGPTVGPEEFGRELGVLAPRAEDDGTAAATGREVFREEFADLPEFSVLARLLDGELEVRPFDAPFEGAELAAGLLEEVREDLVLHLLLGGGGEAGDRGNGRAHGGGEFADESGGVEVIRAEVVSPFREAMGFIEDPAADLAGGDGGAEGAVAELLGRDVEDGDVAHLDPAQDITAFRRRQQAVERGSAGIAGAADESVHLVLHQRLQGGDDHGEAADALVADEGRKLEAEGFAAAGGEDGEEGFVAETGLDDGPLEAGSIGGAGFGAEVVEAEPLLQLNAGIVVSGTPRAFAVGAGLATPLTDPCGGVGVPFPHPRREDRVAARNTQPAQGEGQGLPLLPIGEGFLGDAGRRARVAVHPFADGTATAFRVRDGGIACDEAEEPLESRGDAVLGGVAIRQQEVQGGEQHGVRGVQSLQRFPLIKEQRSGEPGVRDGIVLACADQFVVLHQPVVRVRWEGDGRKDQGVDDRQQVDRQIRADGAEPRQVVVGEIVAEDRGGFARERVEECKAGGRRAGLAPVAKDRADVGDAAGQGDLEVDEEVAMEEGACRTGWLGDRRYWFQVGHCVARD